MVKAIAEYDGRSNIRLKMNKMIFRTKTPLICTYRIILSFQIFTVLNYLLTVLIHCKFLGTIQLPKISSKYVQSKPARIENEFLQVRTIHITVIVKVSLVYLGHYF